MFLKLGTINVNARNKNINRLYMAFSASSISIKQLIRGKQNSLFSKGPVTLRDLLYSKKNKSKFWKTRWDSSDYIRPPLITCNSGQHFADNSDLFPVWRHSFRNAARSWHLAGNSFIVRCHVTMSSQWMSAIGSGKNASFITITVQNQKKKRNALRSRQDSNLRGETPMDF